MQDDLGGEYKLVYVAQVGGHEWRHSSNAMHEAVEWARKVAPYVREWKKIEPVELRQVLASYGVEVVRRERVFHVGGLL